ncbi:hypothetical protein RhiJN_27032 [Ceratobasidium sp. AG-Ba]|nr:hypothetical protein RhiJN_27032 [Ceratobasidium sp. AG-Ba]
MTSDKPLKENLELPQDAGMETTSRLLAVLVNEGLVKATAQDTDTISCLFLSSTNDQKNSSEGIQVSLRQGTKYRLVSPATHDGPMVVIPDLNPADIVAPVTLSSQVGSNASSQLEHRPEKVFDFVAPWLRAEKEVVTKLRGELKNSADNQEKWLQFASSHPPPLLDSPLITWEQRCVKGHPTHPMHRCFLANPPLNPVELDDMENFLNAEIVIISVPRNRIDLNGTFEESLVPLLQKLGLSAEDVVADRVLMPCFAAQLPAIHKYFGLDAKRILTRSECRGQRQLSMRTVSVEGFEFDIKMPLSCTITGYVRTIQPLFSRTCVEMSQLLHDIVPDPEILWIARCVGAACSADTNPDNGKHLCAMLREDLEPRAVVLGQCLVLPSTLFETSTQTRVAHVVNLFNLTDLDARKEWFRNYTRLYLQAVLPFLLSYGIFLEAHMQNMLVRFDLKTGALRGFVYRDVDGVRIHAPTMQARGLDIKSPYFVSGATTLINDLEALWARVYQICLTNHLGGALTAMGLGWEGGWTILREELENALRASHEDKASELLAFVLQPYIKRTAFLRTKLTGVYGKQINYQRPNPLAL